MKNSHDSINKSEGKSDVLEAEPVNVKCDLSENEENILCKNKEIDESECDMINIFYSDKDGIFAPEQSNDAPNGCQTKQEVDSDASDRYEEDIQDSKCFVNEFLDPEGKIWNREDDFSQNRNQHLDHLNTVKSEPPDFGFQSGCDERMNEKTDGSEDDIEDSKFFLQQYLDEEGKLRDKKDTISTKVIGTTECSQHTTSVSSESLGIAMQSGCDEIMNEETKVSQDEPEDIKCFIHEYLDNEGKVYNNIDTIPLKKEGAARELHEIELLEMEDVKANSSKCNFDEYSSSRSNLDIPVCDYGTGSNLQLHIDTVHLEVNKQKCHMCEFTTARSCDLNRHINSVHLKLKGEKRKKFRTAKSGDLNHHNIKKHKCHLCDYSSAKSCNLTCHIDSVHLKRKKEKRHKCHLCDFRSSRRNHLQLHIDQKHLKVKKHKCHLCDYSTVHSSYLKIHIDGVHLKLKKYICHLCGYSTINKSPLKIHIDNVHLKRNVEKKHKCHLCDYCTAYGGNLKGHIDRVHLKVKRKKKHQCNLCEYSTAKSGALNRHIDSKHLNVKKHKCHWCDYSTVKRYNLTCHINSVHLQVKRKKKHKCHLCEYSTAKSGDLNLHIDSVHLEVKVKREHEVKVEKEHK